MSRPKLIAGNWKLNPADSNAALELLRQLKARLAPFTKAQIAIMPPFTMLHLAADVLKDTRIALGAQNLYWEDTGAFTGEISAPMLKTAGCRYVIIGHSERRQFFGESIENVHLKTKAALRQGLTPIVCVGETLSEREAGREKNVVRQQIRAALFGVNGLNLRNVIIAYEPVWAIGTGQNATPQQAQAMHEYIRRFFARVTDEDQLSGKLLILYGGSVKPSNSNELLKQPDIDGALVGGASLDAEIFAEIVSSAEHLL